MPDQTSVLPSTDQTDQPISREEFAQQIKAKYPVYTDVPNDELVDRMLEKYPVYQSRVAPFKSEGKASESPSWERFIEGVWSNINPVAMAKGAFQMARHPLDTGTAMLSAQGDQLKKARELYDEGRTTEAMGHAMAGLLPLIGPAAAHAGERIASGDIAGGVGEGVGLVAPFGAADAVRTVAKVVPESAATALETGAQRRVVDVMVPKVGRQKVRFGTMADKIAPAIAKDPDLMRAWSRVGLQANVGDKLTAAESALDEAANTRLSARTYPTQPIIDDLLAKRGRLTAHAVEGSRPIPSYETSTTASSLSAASKGTDISAGGAAGAAGRGTFQVSDGADLFDAVRSEARRLGYDGTDGSLRKQFQNQLDLAHDLQSELEALHEEHGPRALLQAVADAGGIGADPQYAGEVAQLWEQSTGQVVGKGTTKSGRVAKSRTLSGGAMGGVSGVLKKSGLSLDTMAEALRQDPRFANITGPNELLKALEDARISKAHAPELDEALAVTGVRPGIRWWEGETEPPPPIAPVDTKVPPPLRVARPLGADVVPTPNRMRVQQIDQAINEVKQLGPVARYEPLRRIREAYDQVAKVRYAPSITADFLAKQGEASGAADVTGVLRERLAAMDPRTAAANADYSLYRKASDVLDATAEVERTRPRMGRQIMARLTGTLAGEHAAGIPGAIVGYVLGPIVDTAMSAGLTTKLQTARVMNGLAQAIRQGNPGQIATATAALKRLMTELGVQVGNLTSESTGSADERQTPLPATAVR